MPARLNPAVSQFANQICTADTLEFWFVSGVLFALIATAFYFAFTFLKRKRVMQDTPTAVVRSAAQGYVELNGHARLMDGPPIVAPLTGKTCTWYRYKVEEKRRSADDRRSTWRVIDSGTSEALFHLVDPTGQCVIDPEGAEVLTSHHDTWHGRARQPGAPSSGFSSSLFKNYRYSERRIEIDDPLYAIGNLTTHGGARTAFDKDKEIGDVLREWKRDRSSLLARFDANGDGEIDMHEWQRVTTAAELRLFAERDERGVAPPVDILGATNDTWRPFVISNIPERKLQAGYHWKSIGLTVFALLGSTMLFWGISVRFAG